MDTVYRIYTEACGHNQNYSRQTMYQIENYVGELFNGYTLFGGTGYWRGKRESCLVIEIICEGCYEDKDSVLKIASWIKTTFHQEFVAITESRVKLYTVGKSL